MGAESCSKKLNNTELMLTGLFTHTESSKIRNVLPEMVARLEGIHNYIYELNLCREALKARLREKNREIERQVLEMEKLYQEIENVVKRELPQDSWKEFGVDTVPKEGMNCNSRWKR